jgi:ATP phosphoribosyltransferase regulatory subunit
MVSKNHWLLPQGIEETLPADAARLEALRRNLLDIYASWGYQLVMPPVIEYLESLLTGTGHDYDLQTFKLIDQVSGRLMGVRADMTPQVARIDSHQLKNDAPNRLCYMGTVLRTLSDGFGSSRSPFQAGVELYGHEGVESDVEVMCLMVETLSASGIKNISIDIGHVGLFRGLAKQAGLNEAQEDVLFEMMQRKAIPEIQTYLAEQSIESGVADMLNALPELHGAESCLQQAEKIFSNADETVKKALSHLQQAAQKFNQRVGDVDIHFDLSELRGYRYHTGLLFAAYSPGEGQEIARGGRYDDIGVDFGRARPATGFSTDIKNLLNLSQQNNVLPANAILAPSDDDPELWQVIKDLRAQGEKVIQSLPGQKGKAAELGCDRELKYISGSSKWVVK